MQIRIKNCYIEKYNSSININSIYNVYSLYFNDNIYALITNEQYIFSKYPIPVLLEDFDIISGLIPKFWVVGKKEKYDEKAIKSYYPCLSHKDIFKIPFFEDAISDGDDNATMIWDKVKKETDNFIKMNSEGN